MARKRYKGKYTNKSTGTSHHVVQIFPMEKEVLLTGGIRITQDELESEYRKGK